MCFDSLLGCAIDVAAFAQQTSPPLISVVSDKDFEIASFRIIAVAIAARGALCFADARSRDEFACAARRRCRPTRQ